MLHLTETYTLCIFRKFSAKYTNIHTSKKEINEKNIRVFLGAWTFHTRYRMCYTEENGGIQEVSRDSEFVRNFGNLT